jgi:hypothetical protein
MRDSIPAPQSNGLRALSSMPGGSAPQQFRFRPLPLGSAVAPKNRPASSSARFRQPDFGWLNHQIKVTGRPSRALAFNELRQKNAAVQRAELLNAVEGRSA